MTNVLAFVSIKGGVGKTTLALETAASLVKNFDKRVLLIDANFSAPNIGLYLDLTNEETLHHVLSGEKMLHNTIYEAHGIDVVPASLEFKDKIDPFRLKKIIEKFRQRYDYIILDSSPNHDELRPVINAADKIFLITSPDHVTLTTTLKAAQIAKEENTPIEGIIINRIRSPKHEYNVNEIEKISNIPVMAKIKDHVKMAEAIKERIPISILDEGNTVSNEIRNFASAICGSPEKRGILSKLFPFLSNIGKEEVNREFLRQKFYRSK